MKRKGNGIDQFRIAAAFMIVAIHTAPLSSFSKTADALITYCLGRIAVPFFLMVSGYFILGPCRKQKPQAEEKSKRFLMRIVVLYLLASVVYLPVKIYSGQIPKGAGIVFKEIFFDGTFYHLWYLPATILGSLLLLVLMKKCRPGVIWTTVMLLYLAGAAGDSYYGLVSQVPILKTVYEGIFWISTYTRNGIFYAPVFLWMGAAVFEEKRNGSRGKNLAGFLISLCCMAVEGYLTYENQLQRHNSMYLFLLPAMFFLYQWLLLLPSKEGRAFRSISMWIYMVHPACIILVRAAAKVLGLTELFVENSLLHFLLVSSSSLVISVAIVLLVQAVHKSRFHKLKKQNCTEKKALQMGNSRAWIEVSLGNLKHNVNQIKKILPYDCVLMPAVKANAYGHGALIVAKALQKQGIRDFCVASAEEGRELRQGGIQGEILVLSYTYPAQFSNLLKYDLTQTVVDAEYAKELQAFGKVIKVHVGIDTGMHRLGEWWENFGKILDIWDCSNLKITAIYSHLCVADGNTEEDREFTRNQIEHFHRVKEELYQSGVPRVKYHLQGSYGMLNYPECRFDYARVGIALYGLLSRADETTVVQPDLRPVLTLKSRIECVKTLKAGERAGYGLTYTAPRQRRIAVLSIGYADGVPRELSNCGYVLCRGEKAPIIGSICMDQMLVDVTGIESLSAGEEAVLIGTSGKAKIPAEVAAKWAGTITNELVSRLGSRLERVEVP